MRWVTCLMLASLICLPESAKAGTGATGKGCWGVAIEVRGELVALLAVRAVGEKEAIFKLVEDAKSLGLHGTPEQATDDDWRVFIPFPSPPTTGAKARDLVERAHAGAFGTIKVQPDIMDISVLPRGKCPDAYL